MRRRQLIPTVLVLMLVTTSGAAIAGQDEAEVPAFDAAANIDQARGLVYDGLQVGDPDGPCAGVFEVPLDNGDLVCTQGPDAAPGGLDVRTSSVDLARSLQPAGVEADLEDAGACNGDGGSGPRVQAIYAVASDRTDRFDLAKPYIEAWADRVTQVFNGSAAQAAGAQRHVRWVTTADCELDIARVVLSPSGDDTFGSMINEMLGLGFTRPDRKYLVWMDARVYCGIGQFYNDDRPGLDNRNNGSVPMFARTDEGCWGLSQSVEAHELAHVLGAVQHSAPHATPRGHCWDEWDLMCYNDGSGVAMQGVCPQASAAYLDCNFDDYFHPEPAAGSYLDTHWNIADSSFLEKAAGTAPPPPEPDPPPPPPEPDPPPPPPQPDPPPPPPEPEPDPPPPPPLPNEAPQVDAGPDFAAGAKRWVTLAGSVTDDGRPNGQLAVRWTKVRGPGTVSFENDRAARTRASFSSAGVYVLRLRGADGQLAAADRVVVTVAAGESGDMATERFEGVIDSTATMVRFDVASGAGPMSLQLEFDGETRRGRVPIMVLKLYDPTGRLVAIRRGRSPLSLQVDVQRAGLYTVVVRGPRGTSYSVDVTHPLL